LNLRPVIALAATFLLLSCTAMPELPTLPGQSAKGAPFDIVIRNGLIHDGTGAAPYRGEVAIRGDRIVAMGPRIKGPRLTEIDAKGQAVAPGFINMLSWATDSLIADGRGLSDLKQGVTLEVMGEGSSMGPWNAEMKRLERSRQGDIKYDIAWTTLGEYLAYLEKEGISPNVASFVGAETVRTNVLGAAPLRFAIGAMPFLLPVSIPFMSTALGLPMLLIAIAVVLNRLPWLPDRLLDRALPSATVQHVLERAARAAGGGQPAA
jgi:hypothetical protein